MRNAYRKPRNPSPAAVAAMREIQRVLYGPPTEHAERAEHLARVQEPRTARQQSLPLRSK